MRAHLKRLTSPDIAALRIFRPPHPANFALVIDAKIGVECMDEGETSACSSVRRFG